MLAEESFEWFLWSKVQLKTLNIKKTDIFALLVLFFGVRLMRKGFGSVFLLSKYSSDFTNDFGDSGIKIKEV